MPERKKLVVVLSVLVTGASMAYFFRKDASLIGFRQEASPENPFHDRVAHRVAADVGWAKKLRASQGNAGSQPRQALRVPAVTTAAISEPKGLAPDAQPTFHKLSNPVGALLEPIEGVVPEAAEPEGSGTLDVTAGDGGFSNGASQTHQIADGDTLLKLAGHYLGRGDRYLEIYELNRDVLASPDLLPIGVVLKIPPRQGPAPAKPSRDFQARPSEPQLEPPLPMLPLKNSGRRSSR
jgi:hypothetical protein